MLWDGCRRSLCGTNNLTQEISLYIWIVCVIPLHQDRQISRINPKTEIAILNLQRLNQSDIISIPERQGCPLRLSPRLALSLPLLFLHLAEYKDDLPGPRSGELLLERRYRSGSKSPKISFRRGGSVQPLWLSVHLVRVWARNLRLSVSRLVPHLEHRALVKAILSHLVSEGGLGAFQGLGAFLDSFVQLCRCSLFSPWPCLMTSTPTLQNNILYSTFFIL